MSQDRIEHRQAQACATAPLALPGALPLCLLTQTGVRTFLPLRFPEASDHPAHPPLIIVLEPASGGSGSVEFSGPNLSAWHFARRPTFKENEPKNCVAARDSGKLRTFRNGCGTLPCVSQSLQAGLLAIGLPVLALVGFSSSAWVEAGGRFFLVHVARTRKIEISAISAAVALRIPFRSISLSPNPSPCRTSTRDRCPPPHSSSSYSQILKRSRRVA